MNPEVSILLSFINDQISVKVCKYLSDLKEKDYAKYKSEYLRLCYCFYSFVNDDLDLMF